MIDRTCSAPVGSSTGRGSVLGSDVRLEEFDRFANEVTFGLPLHEDRRRGGIDPKVSRLPRRMP
jgi:hypothetical protein